MMSALKGRNRTNDDEESRIALKITSILQLTDNLHALLQILMTVHLLFVKAVVRVSMA